jgi:hypothetical protein
MMLATDPHADQERSMLAEMRHLKIRLNCEFEDRVFGRSPQLPELLSSVYRMLGAIALGCASATLSLLAVFIIFNLVLNFQPA